jgi:hypothetical protein
MSDSKYWDQLALGGVQYDDHHMVDVRVCTVCGASSEHIRIGADGRCVRCMHRGMH